MLRLRSHLHRLDQSPRLPQVSRSLATTTKCGRFMFDT